MLLAIDPGPVESAYVVFDVASCSPLRWQKVPNEKLRAEIRITRCDRLAVEMIASYGMPVGAEVFETCVWIGRLVELWVGRTGAWFPPEMVFRREVSLHLCGSARAKDPNVRQALIDRYGPGKDLAIGKKASPGVLYGMSGDCWAALGVAVTAAETRLAGAIAA